MIFSEQLTALSLFQGLTTEEVESVVAQTKFSFHRHAAGECIVSEAAPCTELLMLLSGTVAMDKSTADHSFTLTEHRTAPLVLQTEHVFGLSQNFSHTIVARTECFLVSIDKNELLRLFNDFFIVQINLLNLLSASAQKMEKKIWKQQSGNLKKRLVDYILAHCTYPAGYKEVKTTMNDLGIALNVSRINVSRTLNDFRHNGLIELYRGGFMIPAMEKLIAAAAG